MNYNTSKLTEELEKIIEKVEDNIQILNLQARSEALLCDDGGKALQGVIRTQLRLQLDLLADCRTMLEKLE